MVDILGNEKIECLISLGEDGQMNIKFENVGDPWDGVFFLNAAMMNIINGIRREVQKRRVVSPARNQN